MSNDLHLKLSCLNHESFLTVSEIIHLAAKHKSIPLKVSNQDDGIYESGIMGTFPLDKYLVGKFTNAGFTYGPSQKSPDNGMIYLCGNSHQTGDSWDSDVFAWKKTEPAPQLTVTFQLHTHDRHRGVFIQPHFWGNCDGGPTHKPTIDKLAMAVGNAFRSHPIIGDMRHNPYLIVHWNDIGLGGIRNIRTLFSELFGRNEFVLELANSRVSPFKPHPQKDSEIYVIENDQPYLFSHWQSQLEEYKTKLI